MKKLIECFRKRHFLTLGDKQFSPIMEASIGLVLDYIHKAQSKENTEFPLFLCFPNKYNASLWLSIAILRNCFFDDYIYNATKSIDFRRGQKVLIYNSVAEVMMANRQVVKLIFKGGEQVSINEKHWSNISLAKPNRTLNTFKKYAENRRGFIANRNVISKILDPNEEEVINQNNLDSKVLLVSGRGNVLLFKELLNKEKIYGEPISKTFSTDRSVIITPDLKAYNEIFNSDYKERYSKFRNLLSRLVSVMQQEELKVYIKELYDSLISQNCITPEFDVSFRDFVNEYIDAIPKLKFVYRVYPGLKETIPPKLRAVIINDIQQAEEYKNTIKHFIDLKVPVIVISDRNIVTSKDIGFYNYLFDNNPHDYRLNWNRKKINALMEFESDYNYLDLKLWQHSKRYAQQVIELNVYPPHELDQLLPQLLGWIKELDDFEVLQKKFYNYLYPALFALKNSRESDPIIIDLVSRFKSTLDSVEHIIQNKEILEGLKNTISLMENFEVNTKLYSNSNYVFSNKIPLNSGNELKIPLDMLSVNTPTLNTTKLLFTGYPLNEYLDRYLIDSVCMLFVPTVVVKCWPKEASLTYGYLKRRIKSGYFIENIDDICNLIDNYLLKKEEDIEEEIGSYLRTNQFPSLEEIDEEPLEYLHTFKYRGYQGNIEEKYSFTTSCEIVNFENGFFMFIPVNSTVLGQSEDSKGKLRVARLKLDDLNIGDRIFTFATKRSVYRRLSKSNKRLEECFDILDLWRNALKNLYIECGEDLDVLERRLKAVKKDNGLKKGNPVKSSLQRWLFDDEMISPEIDNLRIILKAAGVNPLEDLLENINFAYKSIASFTIRLSSEIRNKITKELSTHNTDSNKFIIIIDEIKIQVEAKRIISISHNKIEVDYSNTRRFLC